MIPPIKNDTTRVAPLYAMVKRHIRERIESGDLSLNARVPSEHELVHTFGISRMTANRALKELTEEGYLVRIPGVGTFVAETRVRSRLVEVRNIADEVRERGHEYTAELLANGRVKASAEVAGQLGVAPGARVFRTLIVHQEEGVPIQLEERFVDPERAPDYGTQDFRQTTPSEYLLRTIPLHEVQHTLRASMPDAAVRRHLRMPDREPCLLLERLTWSGGKKVTFVRLYHPGMRFEFTGRFRP